MERRLAAAANGGRSTTSSTSAATRRGKKTSSALNGIKGDTDSLDDTSAPHIETSAWESTHNDKEAKKHKKKHKKLEKQQQQQQQSQTLQSSRATFPKGLLDKVGETNNISTSSSPGHYRTAAAATAVPGRPASTPNFMMDHNNDGGDVNNSSSAAIPKLPKGKKMVETTVSTDVDSLYRSVFGNDTFFEIVGSKVYEEFRNFRCSAWERNRSSGLPERTMRYDLSKTIAFSRQNVAVEQSQVRLGYSRKGRIYGVDTVTQNSGIVYSDYFRLNIHYRFLRDDESGGGEGGPCSRLIVVADIEFVKPCLFKGRIETETWSGLKKYYDVVGNEVLPEKDLESNNNNDNEEGDEKRQKDRYNKRIASGGGGGRRTTSHQQRQLSSSTSSSGPSSSSSSGFNQEVVMTGFVMVILVLVMLTLALYKMSSTLARMDERMLRIEERMMMTTSSSTNGIGGLNSHASLFLELQDMLEKEK